VNVRKVALALIALQCLSAPTSFAATTKPTPRATVSKAPAKKATTVKKKAVVKKATTVKKKAVVKKKVPVRKYIYHKRVRKPVPPSPSPAWPPHGFTSVGSAYARIPTGTELVGILSAMKNSSVAINSCSVDPNKPTAPAFSCAAILVGSQIQCTWWKISSTITGNDPATPANRITLGGITVFQAGAVAKSIQTIFLVSPIPLQTGVKFSDIQATCGIGQTTDTVPSSTFVPATPGSPAPIATESATASPTPSPTTS
jgi:hypothetical protein